MSPDRRRGTAPLRSLAGVVGRGWQGLGSRRHRRRARRRLDTTVDPTPPVLAASESTRPIPPPSARARVTLPDVFIWGGDTTIGSTQPLRIGRALADAGYRVFIVAANAAATRGPGHRLEALDATGRLFHAGLVARELPDGTVRAQGDLAQLRRSLGSVMAAAGVTTSVAVVTDPRWFDLARSQPGAPLLYVGSPDAGPAAFADTALEIAEGATSADIAATVAALPRPTVTLVVVAWNNLTLTAACLASIATDPGWLDVETIVVDNGSTDGTTAYLDSWAALSPKHRVILNPDNRGFAAACNQGLHAATADHIALLNNDIVLAPGAIATLVQHVRRDPAIGLCGPVTNAIANEARVAMKYRDVADMPSEALGFIHRRLGETYDIAVLAFFCVVMRRATLEKVGDLDERFTVGYFEDDDYCRRVRAAGLRVVCAEDAFVHHESSAGFGRLAASDRAHIFEANRRRFEEKWGLWERHRRRRPRRG